MIIGTIVPNNYFAPWDYVKSLMALRGKYDFYSFEGSTLHFNRNQVFEYAKKKDDALLFIDSDIVFTPEDVEKIETHLKIKAVVTGVYTLFNDPLPKAPAIFKRVGGDYEYTKPYLLHEEGVFKIDACGAGFLGISKEVVKALDLEPFNIVQEGDVMHGEDISFCHRVNEKGFQIWCDSSIKVGQVRIHHRYCN